MPKPNIYFQLDYDQYKRIETQLKPYCQRCGAKTALTIEKTHQSKDQQDDKASSFYHNSMRIDCGEFTLEFQGPLVSEPLAAPEPEGVCIICNEPFKPGELPVGVGGSTGQKFAHKTCYGSTSERPDL